MVPSPVLYTAYLSSSFICTFHPFLVTGVIPLPLIRWHGSVQHAQRAGRLYTGQAKLLTGWSRQSSEGYRHRLQASINSGDAYESEQHRSGNYQVPEPPGSIPSPQRRRRNVQLNEVCSGMHTIISTMPMDPNYPGLETGWSGRSAGCKRN